MPKSDNPGMIYYKVENNLSVEQQENGQMQLLEQTTVRSLNQVQGKC